MEDDSRASVSGISRASFNYSVAYSAVDGQELGKRLKTQEKLLKLSHKTELKNVKNLAVAESIDFVKLST